jgi:hypothetical protein
MTNFFCSEQSRARTEPMYGTAPRVRTWLLLEYPGIWRPEAVEGSTLPVPVKQKLSSIGEEESFHRQLFIRQTHKRSERTRCFIVNSTESNPYVLRADVATCDGPITSIHHPDAERVSDPMFLVCTHGNHDKCCAKFGLPVFHALRDMAREQAWQCSHVGGDRFAGNLLCFPHGIYYGHVAPGDVRRLIESYRRSEIDLKHYRGRCCYGRAVQVAEYFVRAETGLVGLDDFRFDGMTRGDRTVVRFRGSENIFEVGFRSAEATQPEYLTCQAERANPIPRFEMTSFRTLAV